MTGLRLTPTKSWSTTALGRAWNAPTGRVEHVLDGHHHHFVEALAITADGRFLASAGRDHFLIVWDLSTTVPTPIAKYVGDSAFTACAIAADGRHLAVGDDAGRVHIVRLEAVPA